jgi:uncharacterized membrane protein
MQPEESVPRGKVGRLPESFAGALAYITFVPAVLCLLLDPYRRNTFTRFHSIQCLLFTFFVLALSASLKLASLALFVIPVIGPLLAVLVSVLVGLGVAVMWLVLVVKALQGEMFKLPLLGDFAERYAGRL